MVNKSLLLLLSLLILALLGVAKFVWQEEHTMPKAQSPSSKPSLTVASFDTWKTYRNEEYGFEVKYPSDWEVNFRPQQPCSPKPCHRTFIGFAPKPIYPIDHLVGIDISTESLNSEVAGAKLNKDFVKVETVIVNGREVTTITFFDWADKVGYYRYVFEQGLFRYSFTGGRTEQSSDADEIVTIDGNTRAEVFEKIFASFRFFVR